MDAVVRFQIKTISRSLKETSRHLVCISYVSLCLLAAL